MPSVKFDPFLCDLRKISQGDIPPSVGDIKCFAADPGVGWLKCNGASHLRSAYPTYAASRPDGFTMSMVPYEGDWTDPLALDGTLQLKGLAKTIYCVPGEIRLYNNDTLTYTTVHTDAALSDRVHIWRHGPNGRICLMHKNNTVGATRHVWYSDNNGETWTRADNVFPAHTTNTLAGRSLESFVSYYGWGGSNYTLVMPHWGTTKYSITIDGVNWTTKDLLDGNAGAQIGTFDAYAVECVSNARTDASAYWGVTVALGQRRLAFDGWGTLAFKGQTDKDVISFDADLPLVGEWRTNSEYIGIAPSGVIDYKTTLASSPNYYRKEGLDTQGKYYSDAMLVKDRIVLFEVDMWNAWAEFKGIGLVVDGVVENIPFASYPEVAAIGLDPLSSLNNWRGIGNIITSTGGKTIVALNNWNDYVILTIDNAPTKFLAPGLVPVAGAHPYVWVGG